MINNKTQIKALEMKLNRMGNTYTPMADSCECIAKPLQYCKVISLQLK